MAGLFVQWLYRDAPKAYLVVLVQVIDSLYNYFSIPLLTRTLFDPWRHDAVEVSRLPMTYWLQAFGRNLVSRGIGFCVRLATICAGLGIVCVFWVGTLVFLLAWYLLPLLMLLSILFGFRLILGGMYA